MAKRRKSNLDKFYTKPEIVDFCLSKINIKEFDTIIEPSAGDGSFSLKIPNCISFDIQPEHPSIIKQDYLSFNPVGLKGKILVIGNPPFGNNSSIAFKFIKHSVYSDCIAFILPKSFKKQSFQNRIPLNFHLKNQFDLPDNSFLLDGYEYNVPCVFQIWVKSSVTRKIPKLLKPKSFMFVKKTENPDLSIRRVGVNAGKLFEDTDRSPSSHYFIKTNDKTKFINKYNNISFDHDNTAGCNSISKQEFIKKMDYT